MANANGIGYQGGNDSLLTNFYGGILNTYGREQAKVQARKKAEQKSLEDDQKQLSELVRKVNTNGVQPQHIPEINNNVNKIYKTYYKANKSDSREERLRLRLDLEKQLTDLGTQVSLSKEAGQGYAKLGEMIATKPELFSVQARDKYKQVLNKPLSELKGDEWNVQSYISPDTSILDKTFDSLAKDLWSRASSKQTEGETYRSGVTGDYKTKIFNTKSINPADLTVGLLANYKDNSGLRNVVDYQAQQLGITPEQYIVAYGQEKAKLIKPQVTETASKNSRPPKAGGSGGGGTEDATTYRQQLIQSIFNKDKQAENELMAYLPQGSKLEHRVSAKTSNSKGDYRLIRVNIPDIEKPDGTFIPGVKDLDISFSKGDAANQMNAIISTYTGEKINSSKLNIRGGKSRGQQIEIRGKAKANQPVRTIPTTIKKSDIAIKAKNAGYSVSEYTQLLKQKGIKIQ